jgi:subtilisin family serine protease
MMMHGRRPVGLRYRFPVALAAAVILIVSVTSAGFAAVETEVVGPRMYTMATPDGVKTLPETAASGRLVIRLNPNATDEDLQALLAEHNAEVLREIRGTEMLLIGLPEGQAVRDARLVWAAEPAVDLAEPDYQAHWTAVPDDELYDQQWQFQPVLAEAGWDTQTGSSNVTIAILDSGYDPDHEDLVDKYWVNAAEQAGTPGVDDDGNGFIDDVEGWDFAENDNDPDAAPSPDDDVFSPGGVRHGTHCAGLAGATTNNGTGVAGHDWGARIMAVRVGDWRGPFISDVLEGVAYAVDNGADVISLSIGGPFTRAYDQPFASANAAGVVICAAAGNSSHVFTDSEADWVSPVCNDGPNLGQDNFVLGVGAIDQGDIAAGFTNRDNSSYNFVDVMAPGVQVWSTYYANPDFPALSEEYGPMSGTSMACPFAAGLAGLVIAQFPGFSPDDVINQIRSSADNVDEQNPLIAGTLGEGRINTATALGLDVPPEPVDDLVARDTVGDEGGSITVSWSTPPADDVDVIGYNVLRAEESPDIPNTPGTFSQVANLDPGSSFYIDAPVPDDTPYWYQVVVMDESNSVPSEVAGPARARDDLAPEPVENLVAADTQADVGGAITLSWLGYDAPADLEEYRIYRATAELTDVADMEPLVVRGPDESLHYVDRTTVDGTEYWYAVTGVDDADNEETEVTPAGPVVSNPNFSFSYPPGMSIISLGATPSDPELRDIDQLLRLDPEGDVNLAYWDATSNGGEYVVWSEDPTSSVFRHEIGRSWWLKTPDPILINISGEAVEQGSFERPVVSGWNHLGNPFPSTMDFATTEVTGIGQGTPVDLKTSNDLGYTRDYAWGYDNRTNSYRLITGAEFPFATRTAQPRGHSGGERRAADRSVRRLGAAAGRRGAGARGCGQLRGRQLKRR